MIRLRTNVKEIKKGLFKDLSKQIGTFTDELFVKIVERNPYDTGFSSANWNASYNEPDFSVRGSKENVPGIENEIYGLPIKEDTRTIHIANGVKYIEELEQGSSGQAPTGFVALSIAEMDAKYGN